MQFGKSPTGWWHPKQSGWVNCFGPTAAGLSAKTTSPGARSRVATTYLHHTRYIFPSFPCLQRISHLPTTLSSPRTILKGQHSPLCRLRQCARWCSALQYATLRHPAHLLREPPPPPPRPPQWEHSLGSSYSLHKKSLLLSSHEINSLNRTSPERIGGADFPPLGRSDGRRIVVGSRRHWC